MTGQTARILLVADTHLGLDLPFRPRVERRRRGHDFFANFERALEPALDGRVDLVVHGGDLFFRSRVPAALVEMALAPLVHVADAGTPIYLVPGNHERSRIPLHLWTGHPNLHLFDRPKTLLQTTPAGILALSGFPFARQVRDRFADLLQETRFRDVEADAHLLCIHQTVEGAQVGPRDYTFRRGPDVLPGRDIPHGFAAVLAGHIHRAQVLTHDLGQRPLAAPVVYPGSVERTSFAERHEDKGYVILTIPLSGPRHGRLVKSSFVQLPARPMVSITLEPAATSMASLDQQVLDQLSVLSPDSIVRVQINGPLTSQARQQLGDARLRQLAPPTMNISLAPDTYRRRAG